MTEDKIKIDELIEVCQKWNRKNITSDRAMSWIWDLFYEKNIKEWNKHKGVPK